jgi:hypothetical protein
MFCFLDNNVGKTGGKTEAINTQGVRRSFDVRPSIEGQCPSIEGRRVTAGWPVKDREKCCLNPGLFKKKIKHTNTVFISDFEKRGSLGPSGEKMGDILQNHGVKYS